MPSDRFQFPTGIWDPSDMLKLSNHILEISHGFQFPTGIWDPSDIGLAGAATSIAAFQFPTGIWDPSDAFHFFAFTDFEQMFQFPTGIWDPSDWD